MSFQHEVKLYRRAVLNGLVFVAREFERKNAQMYRSGIKSKYRESGSGEEKWAYGVIDRIFEYKFPGAEDVEVIVDCTWMQTVRVDDDNGLTVVEDSTSHAWNTSCSVTYLRHCRPAHILYWPVDLIGDDHPNLFYVIDRANEYFQY